MALWRLLKVQTPAVRLRALNREWRFGAHNFVALLDPAGQVRREMHGIARGPDGAQLRIYGGVLPFRREFIWGEVFEHCTGFYDPSFPQAPLCQGDEAAVNCRLRLADMVRDAVNARHIRYPWPAVLGANSNAYYRTLIAGMGLADVRLAGQLWAPCSPRLLLPNPLLARIAAGGGVLVA